MKKAIFLIIPITLLGLFFLYSKNSEFSSIKIGQNTWNIEIANETNERIQGLSGRESLELNKGLLFIFPQEDFHSIWMKDMEFPIDIIWFDSDFKIVDLKMNISPSTYPEIFKPQALSRYVLEVNALEAERAGIKIGSKAEIF